MSYLFSKTPDPSNQFDLSTISVELGETEDTELFDVIETFENYLRACGYALKDEHLVVMGKGGKVRVRRETEDEIWARELFEGMSIAPDVGGSN